VEHFEKPQQVQTSYRARVEQDEDPKKLGRVRVRIIGIHDKDDTVHTTENLPWAEQKTGITSRGTGHDMGAASVPALGTFVWVTFPDGDYNFPVIEGACTMQAKKGTFGPEMTHPREEGPSGAKETSEDSHEPESRTKLVKGKIKEPKSHDKLALYPFNSSQKSETGNTIINDDTPDNSRLGYLHSSGTYQEIKPDGTLVNKVILDKYMFTLGQSKCFIKGNYTEAVNGSYKLEIKGDFVHKSKSTKITTGKYTLKASSVKETIDGSKTVSAGDITMSAGSINLN